MVTKPELCYRHQWRLGDLLMWDNSMTQHLAISDYQLPLRRLMHRVTADLIDAPRGPDRDDRRPAVEDYT
jgi:alpha-ketoglutarate-dependent taurine dioxygenase